ncbi:MAG: DEAD/DEAH box helicase [Prosthecobacter sp.]
MSQHTFPELGIAPELLGAVKELGFEQPSPIQAQAIPVALEGRDVVGQSHTGSGKTMAFGIPVVQRVDGAVRRVQALILCPTRELAMQVCAEIHKLAVHKEGVRATPVYGGSSYDRQIRALQAGAQIVVGTPGRVLDFIERGTLNVKELKMLVFDEADEMLDMGFAEDIERLMEAVPEDRQTIFFSATFEPRIRRLVENYTRNAATITIEQKAMTVPTIEQRYYEVHGRSKAEVLCRVLDIDSPRLTIVFANTKKAVDDVTDALVGRGYAADRLHGDLNQIMRERVMRNFRNGTIEVLVATDVAARGLDVNDVDLIVNFELPYDCEDYVHRIGRTGRAGKSGKAVSLVAGREIYLIQRIQRFINTRINRAKVPSQEEIEATRVDQTYEKLKAALESGEYTKHEHSIQRLLDAGFTATEISSALMDLWIKDSAREGEQIVEDRAVKRKEAPQQEFRARPMAVEGATAEPGTAPVPTQLPAEASGDAPAAPKAAATPSFEDDQHDDEPSLPKRQTSFAQKGPRSGMVRLFINIGGMDMVRPADIAGMLYNTVQDLAPGSIGTIDVLEKCSFVEVPDSAVESVLETIRQQAPMVRNREVRMDYADRPDDTSGFRPKRFGGGGGFGGGGFKKGGFGGGGFKKGGFGGGGGFGGPRREDAGGGYGGGGGFKKPGFGPKPKPWMNREGEGPSSGYGGGGGSDSDGGPRREDAGGGFGGGGGGGGGGGYGGGGFKKGGFGGGGPKRFGGGGGGFKKKW